MKQQDRHNPYKQWCLESHYRNQTVAKFLPAALLLAESERALPTQPSFQGTLRNGSTPEMSSSAHRAGTANTNTGVLRAKAKISPQKEKRASHPQISLPDKQNLFSPFQDINKASSHIRAQTGSSFHLSLFFSSVLLLAGFLHCCALVPLPLFPFKLEVCSQQSGDSHNHVKPELLAGAE